MSVQGGLLLKFPVALGTTYLGVTPDMPGQSGLGWTCEAAIFTCELMLGLDFWCSMLGLDMSVKMVLFVACITAQFTAESLVKSTALLGMTWKTVGRKELRTVHALLLLMTSQVIPELLSSLGDEATQVTLHVGLLVVAADMHLQLGLCLE